MRGDDGVGVGHMELEESDGGDTGSVDGREAKGGREDEKLHTVPQWSGIQVDMRRLSVEAQKIRWKTRWGRAKRIASLGHAEEPSPTVSECLSLQVVFML